MKIAPKRRKSLLVPGGIVVERPRVLIVDDYIVIRKNNRLLLERMGFEVHEALNGNDAYIQLSRQEPSFFSLIIVDLFMPVLSGEEFLDKCRGFYGGKMPAVLVCSSNSELPLIKRVVDVGISGYIIKPIDYNAFMAKIRELFPNLQPPTKRRAVEGGGKPKAYG